MIPEFQNKSDLFRWLKTNKRLLITAKKSVMKLADPVCFGQFTVTSKGTVEKAAANPELLNLNEFSVKVVINTTSIRDSHKDVHIPGLWKKSLQENKGVYHFQEHSMTFDKIISERVSPSVKTLTWAELGFDYPGNTEALIFDSVIEKDRNPFMAEQYAKGRVNNHSVGMQYVKVELAMNSEAKFDSEEKAVWDKYIGIVANRDEVEEDGYFFAVTEAKAIEGSAVVRGSNYATPTISIGKDIAPDEADQVTSPGPLWGIKLLTTLKEAK